MTKLLGLIAAVLLLAGSAEAKWQLDCSEGVFSRQHGELIANAAIKFVKAEAEAALPEISEILGNRIGAVLAGSGGFGLELLGNSGKIFVNLAKDIGQARAHSRAYISAAARSRNALPPTR